MTEAFDSWFRHITGKDPFPYQVALATGESLPAVLDVPTGAGKTVAAILAWLWRRRLHPGTAVRRETPRRLVYCLPMRTLVEQTCGAAQSWLQRADLAEDIALHMVMGGAVDRGWDETPERDCILVGTQDQLLSRALNRGYSMSRYRWPIDFALLNNDSLWVLDEVQLMDAGLRTSIQLQVFRRLFGTTGPTASLWMSATIDRARLRTVDAPEGPRHEMTLSAQDRAHPVLNKRLAARKPLRQSESRISGKLKDDATTLAHELKALHHTGTLSLVICNQVARAQTLYLALAKVLPQEPRFLVHSRFRAAERTALNTVLQRRGLTGILVATQAVEAGVDISARLLITELAPWSSLVQRFGRCNRYGEQPDAAVIWVDVCEDVMPYKASDLAVARECLQHLHDAGPVALAAIDAPRQLETGLVPRRRDILELFDTSSDLAGHDIDISRFIRSSEDTDVGLAWRTWEGEDPPPDLTEISSQEICPVSIGRARAFLTRNQAWTWDALEGRWARFDRERLRPGLVLILSTQSGGYSSALGFTAEPSDRPEPLPAPACLPEADGSDALSCTGSFVSLRDHTDHVVREMRHLEEELRELHLNRNVLEKAALWHDVGKAHPEFQFMLLQALAEDDPRRSTGPWAKSDQRSGMPHQRRHFRHELASALVALREEEPFEVAYLVAAHHGKVRLVIRPRPTEPLPRDGSRRALGLEEGDVIPPTPLAITDELVIQPAALSLRLMELGQGPDGPSWTEQAVRLLDHYGPFQLAFLEAMLRIADWRASRMTPARSELSHEELPHA
ncbi:MAG: CRISPR-associated helicase Cas3' [Planctomycetota bacterium]